MAVNPADASDGFSQASAVSVMDERARPSLALRLAPPPLLEGLPMAVQRTTDQLFIFTMQQRSRAGVLFTARLWRSRSERPDGAHLPLLFTPQWR